MSGGRIRKEKKGNRIHVNTDGYRLNRDADEDLQRTGRLQLEPQ